MATKNKIRPSVLADKHKDIILSLAENRLNVTDVAKQLYMHRNTIVYNIGRIRKITGKDPMNFYDLHDLVHIVRVERGLDSNPTICLNDDFFGTILNCAVRYAIGRRTYMPSLVIGFITPLIPHLNNKTLWCFDQDVTNARYEGGYGDPQCDEPDWMRFLEAVRAERLKRGEELYKSCWEV